MKETVITGRRAGGNSRRASMRYGSLRDTRIAMTGMFIRKAIGGRLCGEVLSCVGDTLLAICKLALLDVARIVRKHTAV